MGTDWDAPTGHWECWAEEHEKLLWRLDSVLLGDDPALSCGKQWLFPPPPPPPLWVTPFTKQHLVPFGAQMQIDLTHHHIDTACPAPSMTYTLIR